MSHGSVLHIVIALPQHSGKYECQASNRAGSLKNFVQLNVHETYSTPKGLIEGKFILISIIEVTSSPRLDYEGTSKAYKSLLTFAPLEPMRGKRNVRNDHKNKLKQFLISGLVPAIVIVVVLIGVLIWKVRAYDEKYRELTKCEVDRFMAGDPSSINAELGVDDQVFNSCRF